ncbi:MAG TPA: hypothetical protein VMF52_10540 [Steroidobacteraceae bacterium]|nr:hypothetical protein [Steroidobacteraceae bacterium]
MRTATLSGWHIASRVVAGVVGSYVFTWGFVALASAGLLTAGLEFHEGTNLASMLGLLVYLSALCFAFIAASLARGWLVLAGGGALMTLAGWWLSRSLA